MKRHIIISLFFLALFSPVTSSAQQGTGAIRITKYLCTFDTTVLRAFNAPDENGNINAPSTCTLQAEKSFGYIFESGKTDIQSPYAGIDDTTAFTAFSGQTNSQGQLTASGFLAGSGRYNIAEIDTAGARVQDSLVLGTFCNGGAYMGSSNFDMTFVTAGETTYCVSYNKGPEPVTTPPPPASTPSGGGSSSPGGNSGPTAKEAQEQNARNDQTENQPPVTVTPPPNPEPTPTAETNQESNQQTSEEVTLAEETEEEAEEEVCPPMTFRDIQSDNPHYRSINVLWCNDVIHGRTPSIFAPNAPLLRSEAAKIIARALGYVYMPADTVPRRAQSYYKDMTGNEPLAYYIEALTEIGIFQGREDGTFGYDEVITMSEMTTVLERLGFEETDIQNYRIGSLIQRDEFAEFVVKLVALK